MKELFIKSIARWQNYRSMLKTRMNLFEKIFSIGQDNESRVFDFIGLEEMTQSLYDICSLIFPKLSIEEIKENISWYLYEAVDLDEPLVESNGKEWIVSNSSILYDMMKEFEEEKE